MTKLTPGRIAQLAISLGVAGLFVWLLVRTINGPELASAIAAARPGWIAPRRPRFPAAAIAAVSRAGASC